MSYLLSGWVAPACFELCRRGIPHCTLLGAVADAAQQPCCPFAAGTIPLNGYSRSTGSTVEGQLQAHGSGHFRWQESSAACIRFSLAPGGGVVQFSLEPIPVRLLSPLLLPPRCCVKSPVTPVMPNAVVLPRLSQPLCCI